MSVAGDSEHLSIGDVLNELRSEFPEITISKIRFLESQGLLVPERTPSGYRKFYSADVDRLRWILLQQRDHFLPLKVIKGRLEQLELGDGILTAGSHREQPNNAEQSGAGAAPTRRGARAIKSGNGRAHKTRVAATASSDSVIPEDAAAQSGAELISLASGVSMTRNELLRASGLEEAELAQLESFGLLGAVSQVGDQQLYGEEGLAIARHAAGFFKHGIDARHLRMYRNFAEREIGLYEQVLLPVLRKRNPTARAMAHEQLAELAKHGRGLRTVYLRQAARETLGE